MITANQRKAAFIADLHALLTKHGAELEITDDGKGFGMHSPMAVITMHGIYEDLEEQAQFCQFELPNYMP